MIKESDLQNNLDEQIKNSIDPPRIGNQFTEDESLQKYLSLMLNGGIDDQMRDDLTNFGSKVSSRLYLDMAADAENRKPIL